VLAFDDNIAILITAYENKYNDDDVPSESLPTRINILSPYPQTNTSYTVLSKRD